MTDQTRVLGQLSAADGAGVIRLEDRYDSSIDDLWSALTDPARLARWYGEVEGDLRLGGQFTVYLEGPDLRSIGHVEVCDRPNRMRVLTRESDESARRGNGPQPYDQTVEATLTADGDQTVVVIEIRGMPLDKIAAFGAGWQIHAENLGNYVTGRDRVNTQERWGAIVPHYNAQAAALPV